MGRRGQGVSIGVRDTGTAGRMVHMQTLLLLEYFYMLSSG